MSAIFSRQLLFVIYSFVTLVICGEEFFSGSFTVAGVTLLASSVCCFGTAYFVGSWLVRGEKNYTPKDLAVTGAIAVVVGAAGVALTAWSSFHFRFFGVTIEGPSWAVIGMVVALLATKKNTRIKMPL